MMLPTIHLNGTSGADLQDQVTDAMLALHTAMKAVQAARPNGRDYYVQQDVTAFARAQQQHWDRLAKLEAVQADLVAIYESIDAQMTPRKPVTTIRAEWFADGTPATCTCGRTDCDHVLNAQAFAKVRGSLSATWSETK
jgi:hypothetical protein